MYKRQHHKQAVQGIFEKLYNQGDIYKSEYQGWYCEPCEAFFTERQLKEGKCPDCGRDVEWLKEESYFFKLSKYQDRLLKYIDCLLYTSLFKKVNRKKGIVVSNVGDGALGCGPVWEAMNMATMDQFNTLWEKGYKGGLPILFNFFNNKMCIRDSTNHHRATDIEFLI